MTDPQQGGRQFAFLLVDKFSMFSLAAAIDTVRSANRLLGKRLLWLDDRSRRTATPSWRRTGCR
jgi:transcriptional regulator GlxA family with amidase domain